MRILLLLTSHNSLSQRLTTIFNDIAPACMPGKTLPGATWSPPTPPTVTNPSSNDPADVSTTPTPANPKPTEDTKSQPVPGLTYTIEYAFTEERMIEAVEKVKPDMIIGAFLTKKVPKAIWTKYLTLILHPGPPGDAGPSSIDWALSGDTGLHENPDDELKALLDPVKWEEDGGVFGRKEWGVTCLQAEEGFDEGPIWAFETFPLPTEITKSALYRTLVTQAACECILTALRRIQQASLLVGTEVVPVPGVRYTPALTPPENAGTISISGRLPVVNPKHRPLLKANARAVDPTVHTAEQCAKIIRAGDSQPGVQVKWFDRLEGKKSLFIYGAWVENGELPESIKSGGWAACADGDIVATREEAVLIKTRPGSTTPQAGKGIWITHARSPMSKATGLLPPKLPIVQALQAAGLSKCLDGIQEWDVNVQAKAVEQLGRWEQVDQVDGRRTFQQVHVRREKLGGATSAIALCVYFDFYNGACSTYQCRLLLQAIQETVEAEEPGHVRFLVLMGSTNYFSNGIALNIAEASANPALESWHNINAIDDIVEYILGDSSIAGKTARSSFLAGKPTLTERGIVTVAAIQANAAAGGLALATCCDVVLCSANAVLNPHYRGVGLFGSEFHRYHWPERVGHDKADEMMVGMAPISAYEAERIGLVDKVIGNRHSSQDAVAEQISAYLQELGSVNAGEMARYRSAPWSRCKPKSPSAAQPYILLADQMMSNKRAAHQALARPLVHYRNEELSQMLLDFYHQVRSERYHSRRKAFVRKFASNATPIRFAAHNRHDGSLVKLDAEEKAEFEDAPGWTRGEEWRWAGEMLPVGFLNSESPFKIGRAQKAIEPVPAPTPTSPKSPSRADARHTWHSADRTLVDGLPVISENEAPVPVENGAEQTSSANMLHEWRSCMMHRAAISESLQMLDKQLANLSGKFVEQASAISASRTSLSSSRPVSMVSSHSARPISNFQPGQPLPGTSPIMTTEPLPPAAARRLASQLESPAALPAKDQQAHERNATITARQVPHVKTESESRSGTIRGPPPPLKTVMSNGSYHTAPEAGSPTPKKTGGFKNAFKRKFTTAGKKDEHGSRPSTSLSNYDARSVKSAHARSYSSNPRSDDMEYLSSSVSSDAKSPFSSGAASPISTGATSPGSSGIYRHPTIIRHDGTAITGHNAFVGEFALRPDGTPDILFPCYYNPDGGEQTFGHYHKTRGQAI